MKKNLNKELTNGTSFHGQVIEATVQEMLDLLGEPDYECNNGSDKCNFDWSGITENGDIFTVYDWKEYRTLPKHEVIEWHIGGKDLYTTIDAKHELQYALSQIQIHE
jgi:hypothetical protein